MRCSNAHGFMHACVNHHTLPPFLQLLHCSVCFKRGLSAVDTSIRCAKDIAQYQLCSWLFCVRSLNADATQIGCTANHISCCLQESGLFDTMGGISPEPSAANFGNSVPDMSMSLPMHGRYSGEQLQPGPPSRSPELQSGHNSFSGWSQSTGRGLLERVGQNPHPESTEHAQGIQHATLSAYDDRLWSRQGPSEQLQQQPQQPPATTNP